MRSAAAVALADVRAAEALPSLLAAVEDVDGYVRQMAINALGEVGDARALSRLRRALKDERNEVRYQATIAFSRLAGPEDVGPALVDATRDEDAAIRYIALRLAEDRTGSAHSTAGAESTLDDSAMRARAKTMLEHDTHHEIRLVAAIYLAKLGDPTGPDLEPAADSGLTAARQLIFDAVRGRLPQKPEAEDEQEAVELSGALDMRDAIPHLERRAWGLRRLLKRTCAWQAKVALARMGHARAIDGILKDLGSARRETRASAIVAAGRARIATARARLEALGPEDADPDLVKDALALLEERDPCD